MWLVLKQRGCCFRFQSKGQESPAVSFSSHLEEKQLKLCVEVRSFKVLRRKNDDEMFEVVRFVYDLNGSSLFSF